MHHTCAWQQHSTAQHSNQLTCISMTCPSRQQRPVCMPVLASEHRQVRSARAGTQAPHNHHGTTAAGRQITEAAAKISTGGLTCVSASVFDISKLKISLAAIIAKGVSSPSALAMPIAMAVLPVCSRVQGNTGQTHERNRETQGDTVSTADTDVRTNGRRAPKAAAWLHALLFFPAKSHTVLWTLLAVTKPDTIGAGLCCNNEQLHCSVA